MSIAAAHSFMRIVWSAPELQARIAGLGEGVSLAQLCDLARERGLDMREGDLRAAFRQDWLLAAIEQGALAEGTTAR